MTSLVCPSVSIVIPYPTPRNSPPARNIAFLTAFLDTSWTFDNSSNVFPSSYCCRTNCSLPTNNHGGRPGTFWFHTFRSEEHSSEPQSLMRISYSVFCLKNKKQNT